VVQPAVKHWPDLAGFGLAVLVRLRGRAKVGSVNVIGAIRSFGGHGGSDHSLGPVWIRTGSRSNSTPLPIALGEPF
jgi:hypothetical protein